MPFQATNPFSGENGPLFAETSPKLLAALLEKSAEAQKSWARLDASDRASYLPKLAAAIRGRSEELARLATWEMGKHIREARAEVEKCAKACDYYAERGAGFLQHMVETSGDGTPAAIGFRPLGTVFAIMPWNFPYWQVIRFAVPALLAGNAGLLKHADSVPGCAQALEDLFTEAGYPAGLFTNIYLPHDRTEEVLSHPAVAALTLTGSERAGQSAGMLAAKYLKKQVLELGGSDPFIVLADADIEKAAKSAAQARMINTGQSCIAAKRFIIEEAVYGRFADAFCGHLSRMTFGDPMDEAVSYGPLVHTGAAEGLQAQVDQSVAAGASVRLAGGKGEGAFFNPVVLEDVRPGQPAYDEELFGPVAVLYKAKDAEDTVRIANNSPYGLGGSLWTGDIEKGRSLARQVETGTVYLNDVMKSDPNLPFGGVKRSGHGRELSMFGLREFVNVQAVVG